MYCLTNSFNIFKGDLMMNTKKWLLIGAVMAVAAGTGCILAQSADQKVFRLGMIGLDTSHAVKFTEIINDPKNNFNMKVLYAFKGGSPTVESSANRIEKFTKTLTETHGIKLVDSIEDLCTKVDGVLLESVDGRQHFEQVKPVLAARKPVFVDKPLAGNLADALEIFRLAKENNVPIWTSSSLRFGANTIAAKNNPQVGNINGCDIYAHCPVEDYIGDLYYYGIHGTEALVTMMGPDIKTVVRVHTPDTDLVVGTWKDGRIGTMRGMRKEKIGYGGTAFGDKAIVPCGEDCDYVPLCAAIVKFFQTGVSPVDSRETIAIFAIMTAADKSRMLGGVPIDIEAVIKEAQNTTLK
jgi:hypothetical protein